MEMVYNLLGFIFYKHNLSMSTFRVNNMFNFCTSFDQNLSGWNISGLNNANALFGFWQSVTVSTANYNPLLINWNDNKASFRSDLSATFGNSKYKKMEAAPGVYVKEKAA